MPMVCFHTVRKLRIIFTLLKGCKQKKKRKKQRRICEKDFLWPAKPKIFAV